MHGYTTQADLTRRQALTNPVVLQDYVDYGSYNIWIPCTSLVDTVGTALVSSNSDLPTKVYPDAVTTTSVFAFRKPKQWVNGVVTARIHYTGLLVAATNVRSGLRFTAFREGDTLAVSTFGTISIPTPTADNVYMISRGFEVLPLDTSNANETVEGSDMMISMAFRRQGAVGTDTYTSDFELIGIEAFYREYKHEGYGKTVDTKWTS